MKGKLTDNYHISTSPIRKQTAPLREWLASISKGRKGPRKETR